MGLAALLSYTTLCRAASPVIINEIHYHPAHDCEEEEFFELYNASGQTVDLSGWRFAEGIDYTFPEGTRIDPWGYLVMARNPGYLASAFGVSMDIILPFTLGNLSNNGEDIVLLDSEGVQVDRVDFNDRFPWPVSPDGGGPSLECINPVLDNDTPANWRPAGQQGFIWRYYTVTGPVMDDQLALMLDGAGEFLVDQVSLKRTGSDTELIADGGFESAGLGDWSMLGNHSGAQQHTDEAYGGSACLKITAGGAGNETNAVLQTIPGLTLEGPDYVLSFWARRVTPNLRLKAGFSGTAPILTHSEDIGDVGADGESSQSDGVYTIQGSGNDIWGNIDEFHYLFTDITGDVSIEAHVTWEAAPNSWSKAGLMVRETSADNSKHAMAILSRDNGTALQYRSGTGGSSDHQPGPGLADEAHLRLTRTGDIFTAEVMVDGSFQTIGDITIAMDSQVLVGLMVTAHQDGAMGEATFESLLINGIGSGLSVTTPQDEPQGESVATPGARNTQRHDDLPPFVHKIHAYALTGQPLDPYTEIITSVDDVHLVAMVEDIDAVTSVTAQYQVVSPGAYIPVEDPDYGNNWETITLTDSGNGGDLTADDTIYTGIIPAQPHRTLVRYRIMATAGAKTTHVPYPDDTVPNLAYFVYDGVPDYVADVRSFKGSVPQVYPAEDLTVVPVYHLICRNEDIYECEYDVISFGNKTARKAFSWQGTLVYDPVDPAKERKVYDNVVFRLRGGVWRYSWPKRMYKIKFQRGHHFKGHHNNGVPFGEPRRKLNIQSIVDQNRPGATGTGARGIHGINEAMSFWLFRQAGLASAHTTYMHFRTITGAEEDGQFYGDFKGLFMEIEQPDSGLLETSGRPSGNLYKMDSGATGQNGGRAGWWDKEETDCSLSYDDSDLDYFYNTYNGVTQSVNWWRAHLNLDHYYSYRVVLDSIRHYDIQARKNYFYYHNSVTDLWEVIPWDTDLILGITCCGDTTYGENEQFWRPVVEQYQNIFGVEYRNRFREYLQLVCNRETIDPVVDQWMALIQNLHEADRDRWDYMPLINNYPEKDPVHGQFRSLTQRVQEMRNALDSRLSFVHSNSSNFCGYDDEHIPATPGINMPDIGVEDGIIIFSGNQLTLTSTDFSDPDGNGQAASLWQATRIIPQAEAVEWPYHPANELAPDWRYRATENTGEVTILADELLPGYTYLVRVRHEDSTGRMSLWSEPVSVSIPCEDDVYPTLHGHGDHAVDALAFDIDRGAPLTFSVDAAIRKAPDLADVRGWSFGVTHDDDMLALTGVEVSDALQSLLDAGSLESTEVFDDGMTQSVVLSDDGGLALPGDAENFVTATLTYTLTVPHDVPGARFDTTLDFTESLGSPDVPIQILQGEDVSVPCRVISMPITIRINEEPTFIRGDANMDAITDLSDAIKVLLFLFAPGESLLCEDAADANDDGILNLADAIAILDYLFTHGAALPAPGSTQGYDPTNDELDCGQGL